MNLRKFKPAHWVYNLLHYNQLRHNRAAYRKYHVAKPLIASISSKDFTDKKSHAWLDTGDSFLLAPEKESFSSFDPHTGDQIKTWSRNGYLILSSFFTESRCDSINREIGTLLEKEKISFNHSNKLMFANKKSALIKQVTQEPALLKILSFLLDKEVVPFQTINFFKGSEQKAHSDSVHMTTYPLGYLIAAWIALEDITEESGPLFYYPGSHKLPFLLNTDFNEGETKLTLGKKGYDSYEDTVQQKIRESNFEKKQFCAKKGDVLVWHANLLHGGMPILDEASTRKSMVIHYYAKDVIKYHEISERPSLM